MNVLITEDVLTRTGFHTHDGGYSKIDVGRFHHEAMKSTKDILGLLCPNWGTSCDRIFAAVPTANPDKTAKIIVRTIADISKDIQRENNKSKTRFYKDARICLFIVVCLCRLDRCQNHSIYKI